MVVKILSRSWSLWARYSLVGELAALNNSVPYMMLLCWLLILICNNWCWRSPRGARLWREWGQVVMYLGDNWGRICYYRPQCVVIYTWRWGMDGRYSSSIWRGCEVMEKPCLPPLDLLWSTCQWGQTVWYRPRPIRAAFPIILHWRRHWLVLTPLHMYIMYMIHIHL